MKRTVKVVAVSLAATSCAFAFPVFDAANLANNQISHAQTLVQWADSIARLRTQVDQLNQQIRINSDIRAWTGNPTEAGAHLAIQMLGVEDLARQYGRTRHEILATTDSLAALRRTANRTYRAIETADIDGGEVRFDEMTFRRYAVLYEQQVNQEEVVEETGERESELSEELALTLGNLKNATSDAEVQKHATKIEAINGQLAALAAKRRDAADLVMSQKIANDARIEQERLAAAELEARDNYVAHQRISRYMRGIAMRRNLP